MTPGQRETKIKELMIGKDHLERGLAILNKAGYTEHSDVYKRAKCAIDLLRMDITGLQTGTLPYVTVVREEAA